LKQFDTSPGGGKNILLKVFRSIFEHREHQPLFAVADASSLEAIEDRTIGRLDDG
jgi:hypothetical protein